MLNSFSEISYSLLGLLVRAWRKVSLLRLEKTLQLLNLITKKFLKTKLVVKEKRMITKILDTKNISIMASHYICHGSYNSHYLKYIYIFEH